MAKILSPSNFPTNYIDLVYNKVNIGDYATTLHFLRSAVDCGNILDDVWVNVITQLHDSIKEYIEEKHAEGYYTSEAEYDMKSLERFLT